MLKTINLTKNFGPLTAVKGLNLQVEAGELFGLIGPNGAGKTTTLKLIIGLLRPTEGTVIVEDYDIRTRPLNAKKLIGYVPADPILYERLTGREFLTFVTRIYEKVIDTKKVETLLKFFDMKERANDLIQTYSKGMRQKIAILSAIIHEPKILLLDEPLIGLDPVSAKLFKELLKKFCTKGGTVILSTHILEVAEKLCSRIGIINNGELIAVGKLDELIRGKKLTSLEDIFLQLTATDEEKDVINALKSLE